MSVAKQVVRFYLFLDVREKAQKIANANGFALRNFLGHLLQRAISKSTDFFELETKSNKKLKMATEFKLNQPTRQIIRKKAAELNISEYALVNAAIQKELQEEKPPWFFKNEPTKMRVIRLDPKLSKEVDIILEEKGLVKLDLFRNLVSLFLARIDINVIKKLPKYQVGVGDQIAIDLFVSDNEKIKRIVNELKKDYPLTTSIGWLINEIIKWGIKHKDLFGLSPH